MLILLLLSSDADDDEGRDGDAHCLQPISTDKGLRSTFQMTKAYFEQSSVYNLIDPFNSSSLKWPLYYTTLLN